MKCEDIRSNLYFYITGEIEPEIKSGIENHIGTCGECRKMLDGFRATLKTVEGNTGGLPEKNWNYFAERTLNRLYASKPYRFLKTAVVVSLVLFVFAFGYYRFNAGKPDGVMTPSEAEQLAYYLTDFEIPELSQ